MKVLVTGGAGYIGSATVHELCEQGHDVYVFDNLEEGHRDALPKEVTFFRGDLRNGLDICRYVRDVSPDVVIHFAAYAYVGESMNKPDKYYENNLYGTKNLMDAIKEHGGVKKIIFSSSCVTYGTPDELPITEDTPQCPESPYGETKLACERMIHWYVNAIPGMTYTFLRYFNAAGALQHLGLGEQREPHTRIIPIIIETAIGVRDSINVFGTDYDTPDGTCVRDYVHIADLADAHVKALDDNRCAAYNLATGKGYSILELIQCVKDITGRNFKVGFSGRRDGDPATLYATGDKARSELGWIPIHSSLQNIVESVWEWHNNGTPFLK